MSSRLRNSSLSGTLAKTTDLRAYLKYKGLRLEELQRTSTPSGEKLLDMLLAGPDFDKRAEKVGARLCLLELKQAQSRQELAELRRRYERDCFLTGFPPIRVWEEGALNSILGSDQGATSPGQSSGADSSAPPGIVRS